MQTLRNALGAMSKQGWLGINIIQQILSLLTHCAPGIFHYCLSVSHYFTWLCIGGVWDYSTCKEVWYWLHYEAACWWFATPILAMITKWRSMASRRSSMEKFWCVLAIPLVNITGQDLKKVIFVKEPKHFVHWLQICSAFVSNPPPHPITNLFNLNDNSVFV